MDASLDNDGCVYGSGEVDADGVCDGLDECVGADDDCGVCNGANASMDCAGVCNGNSTLDNCNTCDNDGTNDCTQDCLGIWGGNDICGCTDPEAINFNELATFDDGSCQYDIGELNVQWVKTYDDIGDESWCVRQVSDGGFIIAGASNYTGLLIKTDSDGEAEWHQTYENSTSLHGVRQTSDGGFIAVGYYECDTLPGCYPVIYLLKTDGSGTMEWDKTDDSGENNDWAKDVIESQDGNFVITGTWNDDGRNSKAMLRKYSSSGDLMWGKTFSNTNANEGEAMMETNGGDSIFVGYSGLQTGSDNNYIAKVSTQSEQI